LLHRAETAHPMNGPPHGRARLEVLATPIALLPLFPEAVVSWARGDRAGRRASLAAACV